jgi:pyruvate formate lyase activating enzyme
MNCGACVQVCPHSGHRLIGGIHTLERGECEICGRCVEACPTGALEVVGRQQTPEEIMEVVRRDKGFYETSGGGLTLSGGEPLSQAKGARSLLQLAKQENIHTAIETCGYAEWRILESLSKVVDLWLYDVKHMEAKAHRAMTGYYNRRILANLRRLLDNHARVVLRIPLIPGQNDEDRFFSRLIDWIGTNGKLDEIHLMPYNRLAESKYESLGREYALEGLQPPDGNLIEGLKARLENLGLKVRVGGG